MLWGIVFSIVAGMAMSVQGVMNTRLGEGIGNTEANVFVQGTAFLLAAAVLLLLLHPQLPALLPQQHLHLQQPVIKSSLFWAPAAPPAPTMQWAA